MDIPIDAESTKSMTAEPRVANLLRFIIAPALSIREAIRRIDANAAGIAIVVDDNGCLVRTVTDGDIRRAILARHDLELAVSSLPARSEPAITAPIGSTDAELIRLMDSHSLRHIPLVDEHGHVLDLALMSDLIKEYEVPLAAVIMAGGAGMRLRPLTDNIPKPMLPVGDKPLLELILQQLRKAGISELTLTTHYKSEVIHHHFGDGASFGVNLSYIEEKEPLGTAGALRYLSGNTGPILVMNGDILTNLDFRAMLNYHKQNNADITMAVREYEFVIPYGVVETSGSDITSLTEKPTFRKFVNAGIYLIEPTVCGTIPDGVRYDMPQLVSSAMTDSKRVVCFPIREYWLDIGQHADYSRAQQDFPDLGLLE